MSRLELSPAFVNRSKPVVKGKGEGLSKTLTAEVVLVDTSKTLFRYLGAGSAVETDSGHRVPIIRGEGKSLTIAAESACKELLRDMLHLQRYVAYESATG
jgi:hypothetical protein